MIDLAGPVGDFTLLFARLGAMVMLLPGFSEEAIPGRLRLMLALGLTAGLWGLAGPFVEPLTATPGMLLAELATGLALGGVARLVFTAAAMAGSLIALQVGLSSALVADPTLGGHSTLISRLLALGSVVVAMAAGVHHLWFVAIARSYQAFPPGALPPAATLAELILSAATQATVIALGLAAPFLVFGLVTNIALGLAARLAPQIQIFFLAQPLTILAGLSLLLLLAGPLLTANAEALAGWTEALVR